VHVLRPGQHVVEQPLAFCGWCSRREAGTVAFAGVGGERELGDEQLWV